MTGNGALLELDASTARLLNQLARAWGVSKEEAVRRAVAQADAGSPRTNRQNKLAAFKELQRRIKLTPARAAEWQHAVRDARR